jgi:hypothetical protein
MTYLRVRHLGLAADLLREPDATLAVVACPGESQMRLPVAKDGMKLEFVVVLGARSGGVDEEDLVLPGIEKGLAAQFEDAGVGVGEALGVGAGPRFAPSVATNASPTRSPARRGCSTSPSAGRWTPCHRCWCRIAPAPAASDQGRRHEGGTSLAGGALPPGLEGAAVIRSGGLLAATSRARVPS